MKFSMARQTYATLNRLSCFDWEVVARGSYDDKKQVPLDIAPYLEKFTRSLQAANYASPHGEEFDVVVTTTANHEKLKPCPFCGGEAKCEPEKSASPDVDKHCYVVRCKKCRTEGALSAKVNLAVSKWNYRAKEEEA